MIDIETTDTDAEDSEAVNKVIEDLIDFISGPGLELFKERMADKFRTDSPSKSGKSKSEIKATEEGVDLPFALWYVDKGRSITDPSGVQLPSSSVGAGFIDTILDADISVWSEIISEWGQGRGDIESINT